MLVVGIVGGIASGKSLVSSAFAQLGAEVIDADRLGHEVLGEAEVIEAAVQRWGEQVRNADGTLDRRAIASKVFGDTPEAARERAFLEELTHPRITARMRDRISRLATLGDTDVVVIDAALLLEAGWHECCDHIVFVDVPREERLRRARERGWSEAEFTAREQAQWPLSRKREQADIVLDNAGPPEQTIAKVEQIWRTLLSDM